MNNHGHIPFTKKKKKKSNKVPDFFLSARASGYKDMVPYHFMLDELETVTIYNVPGSKNTAQDMLLYR